MKRLFTATAALCLGLGMAQAQTDPTTFLQTFQGTWAGAGESRTNFNDPYVPAECSLTIEWLGRRGLQSDGICSGARQTFAAGGTIEVEADGTLSGRFMFPYFVTAAQNTVAIEAGNLVAYSTVDTEDLGALEFRIILEPPVNGVLMMRSQARIDGSWGDVAWVRLIAQ